MDNHIWSTKFRQNTHSQLAAEEAILSNEVDGEMVFYINADDNFRGLVEKIELAELWGMHMIAPNHNGFMINQVSEIMARMADDGSARGAVIVLDT